MFLLKNAWLSIIRNKSRNILIGIIFLVVACAATITLAIKNTATDLIDSYSSAYEKEVTITFDRSNMMKDFDMGNKESREEAKEAFNNISSYTIDDIKKYSEVNHIESYYYTYNISLNGNSIEKATSEFEDGRGGMGGKGPMQESSYDFKLNGYDSIDSMSEFINGTYTINSIVDNAWEIAFSGNYIFINQELADYNELSLNDKVRFEDNDGGVYEFEIIGIYTENSSEDLGMSMFSNSVNTIITNADALVSIALNNENIRGEVSPTFIIDDYDNVDNVQADFYELGLDEKYILETNEEVALSAVSGVSNVNNFASTFLIITLIIGGIVLFIINMINIRERKYEIGVLRTIGISKLKLTLQFIFELMIVAFVSLLIGASIGSVMAKPVSNSLLKNEIANSSKQVDRIDRNFGEGMPNNDKFGGDRKDNFGFRGIPVVQAYDSIDAVVNVIVVIELLIIGLVLVLISGLAAMISIQRFSPLTILNERS